MNDIVSNNIATTEKHLRNFFILMEVYGAQCPTDTSSFNVDRANDTVSSLCKNDILSKMRLLSLD